MAHKKKRRTLTEIKNSDFVQAWGESERVTPYKYKMLCRWEREGRIRFYGDPACLYMPEFTQDLREGLPPKYKKDS